MANNRMFLVYRPTGDAVYLGRRGGWGWDVACANVAAQLDELFLRASAAMGDQVGISQDDFAIALEVGQNQPHVIHEWEYGSDIPMLRKLVIAPSVPFGKPENQ